MAEDTKGFSRDAKHFNTMGKRSNSSGAMQAKLKEANKELTLLKKTSSLDVASARDLEGQYDADEVVAKFKDQTSHTMFRVPILNLLWTFIDDSVDPVGWDQIVSLLNTLSIVIALVLALACTFQSVVVYEELVDADIRFGLTNYENTPLTLPVEISPNSSTSFLENFPGWKINADGLPECETNPCTASRYLPALRKFVVTNGYASWAEEFGFTMPISHYYNRDLMLTNCFLSTSLLLAVLLFGFGSPNIFVRDTGATAIERHQYLVVARSYFYWVRWVIFATVIFGVLGIAFFFNAIKLLVYVKFPDTYVEQTGESTSGEIKSSYGMAGVLINIACFIPLMIFGIFLSLGTRAAHMYPIDAVGNLRNKDLLDLRVKRATKLRNWLVIHANLPSIFVVPVTDKDGRIVGVTKRKTKEGDPVIDNMARFGPGKSLLELALEKFAKKSASATSGSDEDRDLTLGNRVGVYLTGAGGLPAMDAEIVADTLLDAGFLSPSDLYTLRSVEMQELLYELDAMHNAAASFIVKALDFWYSAQEPKKPDTDNGDAMADYEESMSVYQEAREHWLSAYGERDDMYTSYIKQEFGI